MNKEELERRMLEFSINLVKELKKLPKDMINNKLINQVVRSGTSIGANYEEGNAAESYRDFQHKLNISFKEAKETRYWLTILISANPACRGNLNPLKQEADEFARILGKSLSTCRKNPKSKFQNPKL